MRQGSWNVEKDGVYHEQSSSGSFLVYFARSAGKVSGRLSGLRRGFGKFRDESIGPVDRLDGE